MTRRTKRSRTEWLHLIARELPPILRAEYGRKDVCIPASYHALGLLKRLGIRARLQSMDCIAMNRLYMSWYQRREDFGDQQPMPPDAWCLGITHQNPDDDGYCSHLVVNVKGRLLDCASGQMSRPQHNMTVPLGIVVNQMYWENEETALFYRPSPEPVPPMWQLDPVATLRVEERIEKEILNAQG